MSSNNKHIDDIFRDKHELLVPDTADKAAGWQQMNIMLDKQPKPGPRIRKRVSRRMITYMGLAAIVTTVTYFTVDNIKNKKATKEVASPKNAGNSNTVMVQNKIITAPKVSVKNSTAIFTKRKTNYANAALTKIATVSDTVFQQTVLPKKTANAGTAVNSFYKNLQQPTQVFEISTLRDTLLFGKEGTVIKVPANAFFHDNKKVTGTVKISLTECYNYTDMLAHQLTTLSDDKPLVSGGMIKLDASQNEEQLKVFYNAPLSIAMPMDRYDPEMQLFLPGERKAIAIPMNQNININARSKDTIASIALTAVDLVVKENTTIDLSSGFTWKPAGQQQAFVNYRKFAAAKQVKLFDILEKVKGINADDEGQFTVNANSRISDEKIKQLLADRYSAAGLKKIIIKRSEILNKTVRASKTNVSITKDGFMAKDSLTMSFEQAVAEGLLSKQDSLNFRIQNRIDSIAFFEKVKADSIAYAKMVEFNKAYTFNISQLGWVNCDKFMRSDQPMVEFSIPLDPTIPRQYSRYHLVFTNMKTVLPGTYADGLVNFGKLPVGEQVQVVCITEKDGQAVGCVERTVIGKAAMAKLKFEPMTPESFKQKVSQL